jgi:hypothetical protein
MPWPDEVGRALEYVDSRLRGDLGAAYRRHHHWPHRLVADG